MSNDDITALNERVATLEAEVQRLRAREGVQATFNQYLYGLDTGFVDDILDAYAEDCVLDVLNFPPDGIDMHFESREEARPLYAPYGEREPAIAGGHNATNVAIVVDSATEARLTAYFTTTRAVGVQGGRYEGRLRLDPDGTWRFTELAIISAWGWTTDVTPVSDPVPVARSKFGGRPAS